MKKTVTSRPRIGSKSKAGKKTEFREVTRYITPDVERELWARAAGRCQFAGCNKPLYKSPLTQEKVNLAEKAHIYSFSPDGPRGWGTLSEKELNKLGNLILACHDCHHTIDQDKKGVRYSAALLKGWKAEHEKRIFIVTGINPTKKSHVVLYRANIGAQATRLQPDAAHNALFPDWYPSAEQALQISMSWEGKDSAADYWKTEVKNLEVAFDRHVVPLLNPNDAHHFSIFGFAPMPLLIMLGSLFTDKVAAQVYQLHREPEQTWKWLSDSAAIPYRVKQPASFEHPPVLVISLSDHIDHSRVHAVLGNSVSIWELTIANPHNDFLKSKEQLSQFRETMRQLIVSIGKVHGKTTALTIFPTMPVACAVELGRIRMPKADSRWLIYDYNNKHNKFVPALEIGANHD
jgi:hypothetical protein